MSHEQINTEFRLTISHTSTKELGTKSSFSSEGLLDVDENLGPRRIMRKGSDNIQTSI